MQITDFINKLNSCKIEYLENEPMSRHTTFKIGGECDVFIKVKNITELKNVILFAAECSVPYFVLGKGSNLLVSDLGVDGAVISLDGMNSVTVNGDTLICEAGSSLRSVCLAAQKAALSGLEFAYGIPGTVGGALYMNAGAYGGEMSQVTVSATALNQNGELVEILLPDMQLGYRTSVFKNNNFVIVSVTLKLNSGNAEEIKAKMNGFYSRRRDKQPLEYASAGSTFKRPEGYFAGALIEKNNLKGYGVGDAQVSEKHAGFVINRGNATACDVLSVIKYVQKTVKASDGVELEPEVIFIGRE